MFKRKQNVGIDRVSVVEVESEKNNQDSKEFHLLLHLAIMLLSRITRLGLKAGGVGV